MVGIRTAEAADLHALVRVGRATWLSTIAPLTGPAYAAAGLDRWWTPPVLGRHVAAGNVLLAETPERLLGLALVESDPDALHLRRLYVAPEAHGHGVGTALVTGVLARAEAHPARVVRLTVLRHNQKARSFYRARGFRERGPEPPDDGLYPLRRMELHCDDANPPPTHQGKAAAWQPRSWQRSSRPTASSPARTAGSARSSTGSATGTSS